MSSLAFQEEPAADAAASDTSLVERCRNGDAAAWAVLVRRYQRLVHTIVRRTGLDEHTAADVFQTVFLRLVQHLPRIADPSRLQAWIVTTAKREALYQRGRSLRLVQFPDDEGETGTAFESTLVDESPGPDETLEEWQQVMRVQRALARLDERCRRLLEMLFGNDAPDYNEAAAQLGMPIGSLGPTRARCLEKLRRLVE